MPGSGSLTTGEATASLALQGASHGDVLKYTTGHTDELYLHSLKALWSSHQL